MKVTAVVRNKQTSSIEYADQIFSSDQLRTAVASADHIFLCIPGGAGNDRVFDESVLSALKPSAFLYNISRGTTVDEEALYDYLVKGKIAGAGLDVTHTEPLPPESKLWNLGDQVLITGHSAGLSEKHTDRFCSLAIKNLTRFDRGLPLENRVI
ncbi:MAG TPA: NAD(P)-dependent oxidoreductase, partial [Puia sp.]|nr:NAD(P)-dependent oxidoreductase [Puia sp.]